MADGTEVERESVLLLPEEDIVVWTVKGGILGRGHSYAVVDADTGACMNMGEDRRSVVTVVAMPPPPTPRVVWAEANNGVGWRAPPMRRRRKAMRSFMVMSVLVDSGTRFCFYLI